MQNNIIPVLSFIQHKFIQEQEVFHIQTNEEEGFGVTLSDVL